MYRVVIEFRDQDEIEDYLIPTLPFVAEGIVVVTYRTEDELMQQDIYPLDRVSYIQTTEVPNE